MMISRTVPLLLIFLCGCLWHDPESAEVSDGLYAERIGAPRTERQLARKELVLVWVETPESKREIETLRSLLNQKKIHLKTIRIEQRTALSALVRSGRADLMAGAFTPEEVHALRLCPVLPYIGGDGRSQFCLAVRYQDEVLENLLSAAPSGETDRKE